MNTDTTAPAASSDSLTHHQPVARLAMITLDAARTAPVARFWEAVLGWPIAVLEEDYAMLTGPSHALGIGRIPDHARPTWPDDGHKQFHFDLAVDDIDAATARCLELGAEKVTPQPGESWVVLRDPAGHAFCLTDAQAWG